MPIDPSQVRWDDEAIDPARVQWDDVPRGADFSNVVGAANTVAAPAPPGLLDILTGGIQRGAASSLAGTLHSSADFIDQTVQGAIRPISELLGLDADPLGAAAVARDALGAEREINADRAAATAAIGGRPGLAEAVDDPLGAGAQYGRHILNIGAESLPVMLGAIATRNPELASGLLGGVTGAQEYTDLRGQGVERLPAAAAGVATGGIETAGEAFGLPAVMGRAGRGSLLRAMLSEGLQEAPVQVAQQQVEDVATGHQTPVAQQLGDALDALLVGSGMGAGGHLLSVATDKVAGRGAEDVPRSTALDPEMLAEDRQQRAATALARNADTLRPSAAPPESLGDVVPPADEAALAALLAAPPPELAAAVEAALGTPSAPAASTPNPSLGRSDAPQAQTLSAGTPPAPETVAPAAQLSAVPNGSRAAGGDLATPSPAAPKPRAKPARKPPDLLRMIAAGRGLDRESFRSQFGVDPAELTRRAGFGYIFRKQGGMKPDELREFMQEAGFLPPDSPDAPARFDQNDAYELFDRAFRGGEAVHPFDQADEVARQRYEAHAQAERDWEAEFGSVHPDVAPEDYDVAANVADIAERARAAGVDEFDISPFSDETDAEYVARLEREIEHQEARRGTEHRADQEDRGQRVRGEAAGPFVAEDQPSFLPEPTAREEVEAARRRRDAARNGGAANGRTDMLAGEGELFAGDRPEQARVEEPKFVRRGYRDYLTDPSGQPRDFPTLGAAQQEAKRVGGFVLQDDAIEGQRPTWSVVRNRVEASRDMFVPTRGDREAPNAQQTRNGQEDPNPRPASPAGDDAGGVRLRPDATPELTRRGQFAVDALVRRHGGSVLGDRIARDFRETQTAQLIGRTIAAPEDLAALAEVYRNPIFETLRYVFVDDAGQVVGETAVSSRMPASAAVFAANDLASGVQWLRDTAAKFKDATGFWMLHNHPSGDPSPSNADRVVTRRISEELAGSGLSVKGHVVLNHTRFASFDERGENASVQEIPRLSSTDPLILERGIIGQTIEGPSSAAKIGADYLRSVEDGAIAVMTIGSRGKVQLATSWPSAILKSPRALALAARIGLRAGGSYQVAVVPEQVWRANQTQLLGAMRAGALMDVVRVSPDGSTESASKSSYGRHLDALLGRGDRADRAKQVYEEPAQYGSDEWQARVDEALQDAGIEIPDDITAEKLWGDGQHLLFAMHEQSDGEADLVTSFDMLRANVPDQLLALPRSVAEQYGIEEPDAQVRETVDPYDTTDHFAPAEKPLVPAADMPSRRPGESQRDYAHRIANKGEPELKALQADLRTMQKIGRANFRAMLAKQARMADVADSIFHEYRKLFDKADRQATLAAIDQWENGVRVSDPDARRFFDLMDGMFADRIARLRAAKPEALQDLVEHYFPHIWEDTGKATAWYAGNTKRPLDGNKSFLKQRTWGTIKEGMASGLRPVSYNPVDLALLKLGQMDKFITFHEFKNDLQSRGWLKRVKAGERMPEGYALIDSPAFKGSHAFVVKGEEGAPDTAMSAHWNWAVPEPIARDVNGYLAPSLYRYGAWKALRYVQNVLMSTRLGFSMFHAGFTTLDNAVTHGSIGLNRLLQGDVGGALKEFAYIPLSPVLAPFEGGHIGKVWQGKVMADHHLQAILMALEEGGARRLQTSQQQDFNNALGSIARKFRRLQAPNAARDVEAGIRALLAGPKSDAAKAAGKAALSQAAELIGAVGELSSWLIHQKLVPAQKMNARVALLKFELDRFAKPLGKQRGDYAGIIGAMHPDTLRQIAGHVVDNVDDRLGQMNYDNQFWPKIAREIAQSLIGAVGWQVGTVRTVTGGVRDLKRLASPEPLVAALDKEGAITNAHMGRLTNRVTNLLMLGVMMGGLGVLTQLLLSGEPPEEPKDLFFPKTGRKNKDDSDERLQFPSYWMDHYKLATHPLQTASHKVHPSIGMALEVLSNEDYYGVRIRDEDAPLQEQAGEVAQYFAQGFVPYSITGQKKLDDSNATPAQRIGNFFGVTNAPASVSRTPFQAFVAEKSGDNAPRGARTQEQAEHTQQLHEFEAAVRAGQSPDMSLLTEKERKAVASAAKHEVPALRFKRLGLEDKLRAWDLATPDERKRYKLRDLFFGARASAAQAKAADRRIEEAIRRLPEQDQDAVRQQLTLIRMGPPEGYPKR